jgi:hypothetical protein
MTRFTSILLVPVLVAVAGSVYAIEAVPEEEGWSGYLRIGAGALQAKTNMVSGIDRFGIEMGNAKVDSLDDGPDSESFLLPQLNLNLKYTFETQTQLFTGNSLEDIVQLDTVTVFGVRQQFSDKSIFELSAVTSPAFAETQVWEDPYVVGEDREETDRTSNGLRLEYDKILGSGFGLQYTQRETEIDDELSGTTQLGLSSAEAELLDREGDTRRLVVNYKFKPVGRSVYSLRVGASDIDLDGEAMSGDSTSVQLTHVHLGDRYITAISGTFSATDYDTRNPVFDKTRDDDSLGLALFVFDKGLFDSKDWWGQGSIAWVEQDSNIDFYDQSVMAITLGVQRNF